MIQIFTFLCGKKTEVPDLHKSLRQYMLQKSSQEFEDIQRTGLECFVLTILVPERHPCIFDLENAPVRNCYPIDIGCEILENRLAIADGFYITDPFLLPSLFGNQVIEPDLFQGIPKLGPNDDTEWFGVDEEIRFRIFPAILPDPPARD